MSHNKQIVAMRRATRLIDLSYEEIRRSDKLQMFVECGAVISVWIIFVAVYVLKGILS